MKLFIYLLYDITDGRIDFLIAENILCGIHEKHIKTSLDSQVVFLLSVAFTYSSFKEISFDCTLEQLLWY